LPRTLEAAAERFGVTYYRCSACEQVWLIYDDDVSATAIPVTYFTEPRETTR